MPFRYYLIATIPLAYFSIMIVLNCEKLKRKKLKKMFTNRK